MDIAADVDGAQSCLETQKENTSTQNDSSERQTSDALTVTKEETKVVTTVDLQHENKLVLANEGGDKAVLDEKAGEEDEEEGDNKEPFDGKSEDEENVNGNDDSEEETSDEENEGNDDNDVEEEEKEAETDKGGASEVREGKHADNEKPVEEAQISVRKSGRRGAGGKNAGIIEPAPKNKKRARGWTEVYRAKQEESRDKPESSTKKKEKKKFESKGMIFMCSSETKSDCYHYRVLGLPGSKKDVVEQIYNGMRLFLYDVDLKLMYGIYKAAGAGGYNIEPKAFKSQFPSQVKFKVHKDCLPLPEEMFRKVIKDNYFTKAKFDCRLNSQQVRDLCELFTSSGNVQQYMKSGSNKSPKRLSKQPGRSRRRNSGYDRGDSSSKEARWVERPRKYPRKASSPVEPHRQPLPPALPRTIPQYVYERPSIAGTYRQDTYLRHQSPVRMQQDPYGHGSSDLYARYSYIDRDLYGGGSERNEPYRELRDPYPEHHDRYRDRQIADLDSRNSHGPVHRLYLEPTATSQDRRVSDPYTTYIRAPLSDAYNVSYRPEILERHDPHPLTSMSDRSDSAYLRESYLPRREQLSVANPIYSASYHPSVSDVLHDYRL